MIDPKNAQNQVDTPTAPLREGLDMLVLEDVAGIHDLKIEVFNKYLFLQLPEGEVVWGVLFFGHNARRFEAILLSHGQLYHLPHGSHGGVGDDIVNRPGFVGGSNS